jgi:hypothetical protein
MNTIEIRTVNVVQYIQPLREGGSLPAIVKADDGFLYVLKFRGAGQGKKALISEFIGGELARAIGLKVPELVFMYLDASFSKSEPDEEIQDLLKSNNELWIIDNGASLYFHHNWETWKNHLTRTFPLIKEHVLLPKATNLSKASAEIKQIINLDTITEIISKIPEDWLLSEGDFLNPNEMRAAYRAFLKAKLLMIDTLVKEAEDAR